MATHRVPVMISPLPHDANSWVAPYTNASAGSTQDSFVGFMSGTADSAFKAVELIPEDYASSPNFIILWTSETTANDVYFEIRHRVMTPGTDEMNISTSPTELSNNTTTSSKPGAVAQVEEESIALTTTDFVAGDPIYFEFWRQASSQAGDTKTDDVTILGTFLEYTT